MAYYVRVCDTCELKRGERRRWRAAADCKSVAFGLRGFESLLSHQCLDNFGKMGERLKPPVC